MNETEKPARQSARAHAHKTTRHIYRTDIGPVCMSEEEHDAYLDAKEERELGDNDQDC